MGIASTPACSTKGRIKLFLLYLYNFKIKGDHRSRNGIDNFKKNEKIKTPVLIISILILIAGCKSDSKEENLFHNNWDVSPKEGAFRMDDWIVWGGSVIKAEDDKYYMYASRWPKHLSMRAWVTNSEIVVAVSDVPEGPYTFQKVILPTRGAAYFDGKMTHNPNIHYHDGKYILFYIGTTYDFKQPADTIPTREMYERLHYRGDPIRLSRYIKRRSFLANLRRSPRIQ